MTTGACVCVMSTLSPFNRPTDRLPARQHNFNYMRAYFHRRMLLWSEENAALCLHELVWPQLSGDSMINSWIVNTFSLSHFRANKSIFATKLQHRYQFACNCLQLISLSLQTFRSFFTHVWLRYDLFAIIRFSDLYQLRQEKHTRCWFHGNEMKIRRPRKRGKTEWQCGTEHSHNVVSMKMFDRQRD